MNGWQDVLPQMYKNDYVGNCELPQVENDNDLESGEDRRTNRNFNDEKYLRIHDKEETDDLSLSPERH